MISKTEFCGKTVPSPLDCVKSKPFKDRDKRQPAVVIPMDPRIHFSAQLRRNELATNSLLHGVEHGEFARHGYDGIPTFQRRRATRLCSAQSNFQLVLQ
mmetsp:Transcript_41050/g.162308  ORF Transcript_41050/g.162308 Transcript_41050/m.162308 type:complete len:99 (+) Transcript_41050:684-980(+)